MRGGVSVVELAALAAAKAARGAIAFERGKWRAGADEIDGLIVKRLIRADLVTVVVRSGQGGLAMRVELTLRGSDVLADAVALAGRVGR